MIKRLHPAAYEVEVIDPSGESATYKVELFNLPLHPDTVMLDVRLLGSSLPYIPVDVPVGESFTFRDTLLAFDHACDMRAAPRSSDLATVTTVLREVHPLPATIRVTPIVPAANVSSTAAPV